MVIPAIGDECYYYYKGATKALSGTFGPAVVIGKDRGLIVVRNGSHFCRVPQSYIRSEKLINDESSTGDANKSWGFYVEYQNPEEDNNEDVLVSEENKQDPEPSATYMRR